MAVFSYVKYLLLLLLQLFIGNGLCEGHFTCDLEIDHWLIEY